MPHDPGSAHLEIHQVNVGQGDCTVIVVRNLEALKEEMQAVAKTAFNNFPSLNQISPIDYLPWSLSYNKWARRKNQPKVKLYGTIGKTLVVDGGNDCYGVALREYLEEIGAIHLDNVREETLEILVTHYHDDHQDGLRSMMRDPAPAIGEPTVERVRPARFYRMSGSYSGSGTGRMSKIKEELDSQDTSSGAKTAVGIIPRGGRGDDKEPAWIGLGSINQIPVRCRILASDLAVLTPTHRKEVPRRSVKGKQKIDQNDRSTVLVVEYGSFRHFIGGDAGGALGAAYANVEGTLGPAMENVLQNAPGGYGKFAPYAAAHCCCMKLNHHGTRFSNDEHFLRTVKPRIVLVPAGWKAVPHGHPMEDTMERLMQPRWDQDEDDQQGTTGIANTLATFSQNRFAVFATEIPQTQKKKGRFIDFRPDRDNRASVLGSIVIRPYDEDVLQLSKSRTSRQSGKLRILVYGDRILTPLDDGYLRDPVPATDGIYPSLPFGITCFSH